MKAKINNLLEDLDSKLILAKDYSFINLNDAIFSLLKVINFYSDPKYVSIKVGLDLGFILDNAEHTNTDKKLLNNLFAIEGSNQKVKGVSGLLSNILEEYNVKQDFNYIFNNKNFNYSFKEPLQNLLKCLDRYADIIAIFENNFPKASLLIFFKYLLDMIIIYLPHIDQEKHLLDWFYWRKQKQSNIDLYKSLIGKNESYGFLADNDINSFLAFLCINPSSLKSLEKILPDYLSYYKVDSKKFLTQIDWD